ncbi:MULTISPECIES: hypothetical protein [unclassified Lysobacter]|uniref:hypothetical protein n=1 Tax=unclassified Lysobacter TaxID=2635362 RepID=UPI001BEBA0A0|nr:MULTISPECIES: hypothetical protein [unclassified Lysobacter]MBT2748295.1 hypothetical protein [Lysobacter sp. ISL-42]MBT2749938.1 hypothetical protein [Lysobacter sp. ISL-50]MBT2781266.1 hypothetical protein [Lysobacter sp. ISL-52]
MRYIAIPSLIMLMTIPFASAQPPESNTEVAKLAVQYASAQNESQRLLASIEAIDRKLICKGCELETINAIFGTRFSTKDFSRQGDDGLFSAVVPLRPPAAAVQKEKASPLVSPEASEKNPPSATAITGWRLGLKYDNYGKVRLYYLANATLAPMGF